MKNLIRTKPFKIFKALYANRILIEPKKKKSVLKIEITK